MAQDEAKPTRITLPVGASEDEYVADAYISAAIADADRPVDEPRRRHSSGLRFARTPALTPPPTSGVFTSRSAAAREGHTDGPRPAEAPPSVRTPSIEEVRRLVAEGEPGRALMVAERALAEGNEDPAAWELHAAVAREALAMSYREQLGGGGARYFATLAPSAIRAVDLDPRLAFVLSLVDGGTTLDEIIDLTGLPALDALRSLHELAHGGLIERCAVARR